MSQYDSTTLTSSRVEHGAAAVRLSYSRLAERLEMCYT